MSLREKSVIRAQPTKEGETAARGQGVEVDGTCQPRKAANGVIRSSKSISSLEKMVLTLVIRR